MISKKELIKEWIRIAEEDYIYGITPLKSKEEFVEKRRERFARDIGYHMQQCIEKYLKAFLILHDVDFEYIHKITKLIELCKQIDESFEYLHKIGADKLTVYALGAKYPPVAFMPTLGDAKEAVEIAEKAKDFIRRKLGVGVK